LRRRLVEGADRLVQPAGGIGGEIVDDADGQLAQETVARGARLGAKLVQGGKQPLARLVDQIALLGELEARAAALAEADAQALLQRRHMRADSRLADIEVDLRRRESAGL